MNANEKTPGISRVPAMASLDQAGFKLPDPAVVERSMADIAERSQRLVAEWLKRQSMDEPSADALSIGRAFLEMTAKLIANPAHLMQAQLGFWQDYMTLWPEHHAPDHGDRR